MTVPKEKETVFSFLEKLKELNWFYFDNLQRDNHQEVLDRGKLFKQLQEINPYQANNVIDQVIEKLLDPQLDNQQFLNYLHSGVTIHINGESHWVQLIDFRQPEKNKFRYLPSPYFPLCNQRGTNLYPDLILFVNYLPLVVCEFKDWGKMDWREEAYQGGSGGSIEKYARELPQLFRFNAFNVLSNGRDYLIGTATTKNELFTYTPWRWEKYRHNIFFPAVFCDVLENFLVFTKHEKNKRIIRYHQYACLQEVLKIISQDKSRGGIINHTTGSGKSDTMVFLTKKLRQRYQQCTIIIITDRQELDLQLLHRFKNYEDIFFSSQEFIVIMSIRDLRENLAKPNLGKIIFVLIQKFQTREFQELPTFHNSAGVFIFIDEYHRSQNLEIREGDNLSWSLEMRKSLPEAFIFGFTATPKEETYQNIIHSYSMDDALQDEVIVKIVYEIYQYLDLNKIKKNLFLPKSVLPSLQVKGEFFKRDYENFSLNNQLNSRPKVMYIAQSIPTAHEFYKYLSQDPQYQKNICLVTSAQEKEEEKTNIYQFKNTDYVNIAIVVDKLTTGFNLENLQRIYLDQKINSPHRLFQKISRVNRKYPHKNLGFVIDLADNKEVLEETLLKYVGKSGGIIKISLPDLQPIWNKIENFLANFSSRTEFYQNLFEREKIQDFDFTNQVLDYCYQKSEKERKEFYLETKNLRQILISRWYNQTETEKKDLEFIKWCFKLANTCRPHSPQPVIKGEDRVVREEDKSANFFDFIQTERFIIPEQISSSQIPFVYKNQQEEKIKRIIKEWEDYGLPTEEWENKLTIAQEEYKQKKVSIKELNDYLTNLTDLLVMKNEEIKKEIEKNVHYPLTRQILQELSFNKNDDQKFVSSVLNYFLQLNHAIPDWNQRKEKRREGRKEINEFSEKFFGKGLKREERENIIRIIENYFSSNYYLEKISQK